MTISSKEHALRNFTKANLKVLSAENLDHKLYEQVKKNFFSEKLRLRFGMPKDREIADIVIRMLIAQNKPANITDLEELIQRTSLLKSQNFTAADYMGSLASISQELELAQNIHGLTRLEQLEKLKTHIIKENAVEIDAAIKDKRDQYKQLPSIFDDRDYQEPDTVEIPEEKREWWEILNLKENPFPDLQGLFRINQKFYDEIILQTDPIKWIISECRKAKPDIFHKAYLLSGDFGEGKTTLFDYVSHILGLIRIESIMISISPNIDVERYVASFQTTLASSIIKLCKKHALSIPDKNDFEETKIAMLSLQDHQVNGFVIFLDDLHKHPDTNKVFDFLSTLQIQKNNFIREGINVSFVVAGFRSWQDKIKQDTRLTGFFDDTSSLSLPKVSPELAAQVIQKRLKVFSTNPEKDISIKDDFYKMIFRKLEASHFAVAKGFRLYIDEVISHFKQKRFDILSVNFAELDSGKKEEIRKILETNGQFKVGINKLIFGKSIQKKQNRELTLKIICNIYQNNGIAESEDIFKDFVFHFNMLKNAGLISKYDRNGILIWNLSPFLLDLNKKIITKFNLSLEDYLVPIYSSTPTKSPEVGIDVFDPLEAYSKSIEDWEKQVDAPVLLLLKASFESYKKVIYPIISDLEHFNRDQLPDVASVSNCVWTLMKAIIKFESPTMVDISGEGDINGWLNRNRTLEYAHSFIQMLGSQEDGADKVRLLRFAEDAFKELWDEFSRSIELYKTNNVKAYQLPCGLLNLMFKEYDRLYVTSYSANDKFESVSLFVADLEKTIRKYLLVSNYLIFGPYHKRISVYPEAILKYISKNQATSSCSYESYNEFEHLNRGQYKELFLNTPKGQFNSYIVEPVLKNWDAKDAAVFFNMFGDINITTSHNKAQQLEHFRKDVPTFIRLSSRFVVGLLDYLRELIATKNIIITEDTKTLILFGQSIKMQDQTIRELRQGSEIYKKYRSTINSNIFPHEIPDEQVRLGPAPLFSVTDNIFNICQIDLFNIDHIKAKFNLKYPDVIGSISRLIYLHKIIALFTYGDRIVLKQIN